MIRNILLATDGSEPADRAAAFAASLATSYGAKVTVLHAFWPSSRVHQANALVVKVADRLREMGVTDVETEVVEGPPVSVITEMAAASKPDLLVMGARGMGTWQGTILGSVSMAVTQRAPCPVLVVK